MTLSAREISQLRQIVSIAEKLIAAADGRKPAGVRSKKPAISATRRRRSGKELAAFRKLLKSERKRGVPVAELAREHGISPAYIYMIK